MEYHEIVLGFLLIFFLIFRIACEISNVLEYPKYIKNSLKMGFLLVENLTELCENHIYITQNEPIFTLFVTK